MFSTATPAAAAGPGSAPGHAVRGPDARTRAKVLRAVVERGPVTAAVLAEEFGLTATAVRRHLDALEESGRIRLAPAAEARKGRGRPARAYVAGEVGTDAVGGLATEYDDVATQALRFLAEQAGPQAVAAFAKQRVAGLEERYGALVRAAGPDVMDRARALARALADDGFAATARPVGPLLPLTPARGDARPDGHHDARADAHNPEAHAHLTSAGVQLCQGHCPVQHVAAEFPQFCEAETEAFARLLGVHVQRLATLAGGGHACTTYVPNTHPPHGPQQDSHQHTPPQQTSHDPEHSEEGSDG